MLLVLTALLGCKPAATPDTGTPTPEPTGQCDPRDPSNCMFPYPSRFALVDDPTTTTGLRVSHGPEAMPVSNSGVQLSPEFWNERDGFSINSNMVFFFEDGSETGLYPWHAIDQYTGADVNVVLVDTVTSQRVPIWVERDASGRGPEEAPYIVRTGIPLEYDRDYVIGVRGLLKENGSPVDVSESFAALRDGTSGDAETESLRARFDSVVVPALEAEGFVRDELQLAWEFHTISRDDSLGRMVWMRDDALAGLPATGPAYTIDEVETGDCTEEGTTIGRTLEISVTAPLYTESDGPNTFLTRDEDGMPFRNGETTFGVTVRIPCSVLDNPGPARVMQYGHGLLGDRGEVRSGWLGDFADQHGWILVAANWTGMSAEDVLAILNMASTDPSRFAIIPERSMQGLVQQLLVAPLITGDLMNEPDMMQDGQVLVDPTALGYYGNSQGAIIGAALMALSQDIDRGVLGVSGVNYGLLLTRSVDFEAYFLLFQGAFSDDRDVALLLQGMIQQLWDPGEGAGYLWAMNRDPLPDTPPKDILVHTAIGDTQVTTIAGQIQARAYGASLIEPAYRPVWDVAEQAGGFSGSALVEWHYDDAAIEPDGNVPPNGADPHECPRREPASFEQVRDFLETGVINQYCTGVCSSSIAEVCP